MDGCIKDFMLSFKKFPFTDDYYNDSDVRSITVESVVTVLYRMRMVKLGHDPVNVMEIIALVSR